MKSIGSTKAVHKKLVDLCNTRIAQFIELKEGSFIDLGERFKTRLPLYIGRDLCLYRMKKKFYDTTDESNSSRLRDEAIASWYRRELENEKFSYSPTWEEKWLHLRSSLWLHRKMYHMRDWLTDPSTEVNFTSGESYNSSQGNTSMSDKLRAKENYTVTYEAAPLAIQMLWHNALFREITWSHLATLSGVDSSLQISMENSDFTLFAHMCSELLFIYVPGSRVETVPKNKDTHRTIVVEPFLNMLLQRQVGLKLQKLLSSLGCNVQIGQHNHGDMIADKSVATIDFSNASDSHLYESFERQFPSWFVDYISTIRSYSSTAKYSDNTVIDVVQFKLSSMGCGFTFEVMTLLLLSLGRCLDPNCSVYGDDVIINNNSAEAFIKGAEALGWEINKIKTFVNSPFRESCGKFFHDEIGYLTSFDFHWCENIVDVIVSCNKLRQIMKYDSDLYQLWEDIVNEIPASLKGPVLSNPNWGLQGVNSFFVEVDNARQSHKRNKRHSNLFTKSKVIKSVGLSIQDPIEYIIKTYRSECVIKRNFLSKDIDLDLFEFAAALSGRTSSVNNSKRKRKIKGVTLYITRSQNILSQLDMRSLNARRCSKNWLVVV